MKAVLLSNVLYKGQRYKAGTELNLDAVTAGQFERAGLAFVEPAPRAEAAKIADSGLELPTVEKKTRPTGKKTVTPKSVARGQK